MFKVKLFKYMLCRSSICRCAKENLPGPWAIRNSREVFRVHILTNVKIQKCEIQTFSIDGGSVVRSEQHPRIAMQIAVLNCGLILDTRAERVVDAEIDAVPFLYFLRIMSNQLHCRPFYHLHCVAMKCMENSCVRVNGGNQLDTTKCISSVINLNIS